MSLWLPPSQATPTGLYLGTTPVKNVYLGTSPVWSAVQPIAFDATGAGAIGSASFSWTHVITGNAILGVAQTQGASAVTMKVGTTSMTLIKTQVVYSTFGVSMYVFELLNPPTGTQTITVTATGGTISNGNTVSYKNVGSFGTPVTATGTASPFSQTVTSATGQMIFQSFGAAQGAASAAYNQTQRYNQWTNGSSYPLIIGDAAGASSVTFTATNSAAARGWAGVAIPLIP